MSRCIYCDTHFNLCHNKKSKTFLAECPQQSKKCSLYKSRTEQIIEVDWTEDEYFHVFVYWGQISCFTKHHDRTEYLANVKCKKPFQIRLFYCEQCDTYRVNGYLLPEPEALKHQNIVYIHDFTKTDYDTDYTEMSPSSILTDLGYNVRAKTTPFKRHCILDDAIKKEILTPYEIVNHLHALIKLHIYDSRYVDAIPKWREDMQYVSNYEADEITGKFVFMRKY